MDKIQIIVIHWRTALAQIKQLQQMNPKLRMDKT